jgi:hypothetical protein
MRNDHRRYLRFACMLAALAVVVVLFQFRTTDSADVRVQITDITLTNDHLIVSAVATNLSSETLSFRGKPPPADIHWQTDDAWMTSRPKGGFKSSIGLLSPGKAVAYQFSVPASARHLRVRCEFETMVFRGRLWNRVSQASWAAPVRYLLELAQDLWPEQLRGVEFWSEEREPTGKSK